MNHIRNRSGNVQCLVLGLIVGLIVCAIVGSTTIADTASPMTAQGIIGAMKKNGEAIHDLDATLTIQTYTNGKVALTQEIRLLLLQPDKMRLEYLEPSYLAGNLTLIVGDSMWVYIAASNQWFTKDLTTLSSAEQPWLLMRNILRDVHDILDDYTFDLKQETAAQGAVYHLDGIPASSNATYGRIELWVDAQALVPIERKLYDVNGNLLADTRFAKITQVASGMYLPLEMDTYDPSGALANVISYTAVAVNHGLDPGLFAPPGAQGPPTGGGND